MHAIVAQAPGGPEVLEWIQREDPTPGPGELLVRLEAAGVNFIDTYQRSGTYPVRFPLIPGSEGVGRVVAVGSDAHGFGPGDRVAWTNVLGSCAELVRVPAAKALAVPEAMAREVAAALPMQGMTAHYLVHSTFPVDAGTTVLITAGAGGVGRLAIQLAKAKGARVITTVGTPGKVETAKAAGADHVIVLDALDNLTEGIPRAVREVAEGGVDVVYDGIGKDTFDASLASLRPRGLLVLFGGASGQVPPFDLQRLNALGSLYVTRPSLGHYVATRAELEWRAEEVFSAVQAGALKISVGAQFPLKEAAAAHRALESRQTTGKVILLA